MADTKVSALSAVASVVGAQELPVNDAGTSKKATATQVKTFVLTAPAIPAGSATAASWPTLGSGTLLTTAEAGAIERDADAFYATTDAGNRGVVQSINFCRQDANYTLTSTTSAQQIFNASAAGTLTLEVGTYLMECLLVISSLSATSGNGQFQLVGGGTATVGTVKIFRTGRDTSAPQTVAAYDSAIDNSATSSANMQTAATATAIASYMRGTFEVTVAGTIIPSIALTTAAAGVVEAGSYFLCNRIGSVSAATVGQWS